MAPTPLEIFTVLLFLLGSYQGMSYRVDFQAFDASEPLLRFQQPLQLHMKEKSTGSRPKETLAQVLLSVEGDSPMQNISGPCQAIMRDQAKQGGDFTHCLLDHARPFRLCEKCITEYTLFTNLYQALLSDEECAPALLLADRMQVLSMAYTVFTSTWSSADCASCYDTVTENATTGEVTFNYTVDALLFQEMHSNVTHCFNNSNKIENGENRVCKDCLDVYGKMNGKFSSLHRDSGGHICMDLVDMMNYTRLMWSSKYGCKRPQPDASIVITLSVIVSVITILLYLTSKFIAKIRLPQIFKAKRMMTGSRSGGYGSMGQDEVGTSLPRFGAYSPTHSTTSVEHRRVDSQRDVDGNGYLSSGKRS